MIIKGIPSGDAECWCFLVDKETFQGVTGKAPGVYDVGRFAKKGSPYRYTLYPGSLLGDSDCRLKGQVVILSIEAEPDRPGKNKPS